ncbi:heparan-alpha-glucosaminide N-acetyltransferase-like isoform X2 [Gigantopelta aegis]|uniref:heparan-alpha-glucosaminide N-acetyltransferase-like isoform X2 n=1 Tax=Gigantopelta aegis TaxID=1735272 RepID=UPI001B889581|nr:heparan-alpha-glucosaminide N-acetyltransferase-like isoform X2 [Gigantopelta aegis]
MAASIKNMFMFIFCIAIISHVREVQAGKTILPFYCDQKDIPKLTINTGHLTINNDYDSSIVLLTQSENCYGCNLITSKVIQGRSNCTVLVDTRWRTRMEVRLLVNGTVVPTDSSCSEANISKSFLENGEYELFINKKTGEMCAGPILQNDPSDSNIPIYVAIGIMLFLSLIWILMKYLYREGICHRIFFFWSTEGMMVAVIATDLGSPTNINAGEDAKKETSSKKERLRSLDTFRGLSILVMIFVNLRAGDYWFFKHSKWNGLHLADLVFPWFVFIMGTSMVFSFSSQVKRSATKKGMFWKIFKRSVILFGLGLFLNSGGYSDGVELSKFRIPGVLQRFGGTYLIIATIHMFFVQTADENQHRWWSPVRDVFDYWVEWIINIVMVIVWIGITFGLKVPGCPTGYLSPGGMADHGQYPNCTGGAAGYIDRQVFGDAHIYQHNTAEEIYHTPVPHDPEGLLGTLMSCFMCFLGLQAGKILFVFKDWVQRIKRFAIWGIVLGILGLILTKGTQNEGWIPACKNLWSLSFVLILSSFAFILLMICYLLIDVWKIWTGAPFYYPGMNSIFMYVGHDVFSSYFPIAVWVAKQSQHVAAEGPVGAGVLVPRHLQDAHHRHVHQHLAVQRPACFLAMD